VSGQGIKFVIYCTVFVPLKRKRSLLFNKWLKS